MFPCQGDAPCHGFKFFEKYVSVSWREPSLGFKFPWQGVAPRHGSNFFQIMFPRQGAAPCHGFKFFPKHMFPRQGVAPRHGFKFLKVHVSVSGRCAVSWIQVFETIWFHVRVLRLNTDPGSSQSYVDPWQGENKNVFAKSWYPTAPLKVWGEVI